MSFPSLPMVGALAVFHSFVPLAQAHMALWHPSMYGFSQPYDPVTPLSGKAFDDWWFHGNAKDSPTESMSLTPGTDLTVELACRKVWSSYGGGQPTADACPIDSGAYHSGGTTDAKTGWTGNKEGALMGCALAIAFKPTAADVQPEDFTVMSVQDRCVRQRETTFSLPSNLPACPAGGCTCAWFWSGKNSDLEMYMSGFRCDVKGGVQTTDYPKPKPPTKGGNSDGPTQPMYWANTPTNLDFTPTWETKPSYNSAFGWTAGAQNAAFGAVGSGPANNSVVPAVTSDTAVSSTVSSSSPVSTSQPGDGDSDDGADSGDDAGGDAGDDDDVDDGADNGEPTTNAPSPSSSTSNHHGHHTRTRQSSSDEPEPTTTAWNNLAAEATEAQTGDGCRRSRLDSKRKEKRHRR